MRGSLIVIAFFAAGLALGRTVELPVFWADGKATLFALYVLMFLVGMSIGADKAALQALRRQPLKIVWVPLGTILGTLAGVALASVFIQRSTSDCLAVGAGFGYYSLSSIFITQYKGAELGTIALVSNIMRELIALVGAPLLVRWFGKLAPISVGGATTMDTTLPVITRYAGKEFVVISIFHGFVVDFSVPFLVTFFCTV